MPAAPLIKLPDAIAFETAAAMTMRGLTSAYLLRRIRPLQGGRHHPAARRRRRRRPDRLPVGEAARPHGHRHGLDRREGRARPRPRLRPHDRLHARGRRHARPRAHRRRRRAGGLRQRRQGHLRRRRWTRSSAAACWSASAPRRARCRRSTRCSSRSRARSSSRGRRSPTTSPTRPSAPHSPGELFGHVAAGRIQIEINQRYELDDAAQAHRDLEGAPDHRLVDLRRLNPAERHHDRTPPLTRPPIVRCHGARGSHRGRAADLHHRRRARATSSLADAARDDALFAEIRALLLQHKVLFLRDQDITPRRARGLRRAGSARSRTIRSPAAIPTIRAWCASTRTSTARPSTTRTPGTATPPGARRRRWAACCAASRAPRSAATRSGSTWPRPTTHLPEHIKDADRGPARPPQHRGDASARRCRSRSATR